METLIAQTRNILEGKSLSEKLAPIVDYSWDQENFDLSSQPGRSKKLKFSNIYKKFPKNFASNENKAFAIHSFANHELLAIEIMAYVLLLFPHETDEQKQMKRAIISSLNDEQEHFALYESRLNELGYEFGDFPLNDFFWKHALQIKNPAHYFSSMSLTFEAANLDFSAHFKHKFEEVEDFKSAKIMETVFKDELSHVRIGVHYLEKWKEDREVWNYYLENLIFPLTPARSKGINFSEEFRRSVGLNPYFIEQLKRYDDGFVVTKRTQ